MESYTGKHRGIYPYAVERREINAHRIPVSVPVDFALGTLMLQDLTRQVHESRVLPLTEHMSRIDEIRHRQTVVADTLVELKDIVSKVRTSLH